LKLIVMIIKKDRSSGKVSVGESEEWYDKSK
jgi:hypothetical protein